MFRNVYPLLICALTVLCLYSKAFPQHNDTNSYEIVDSIHSGEYLLVKYNIPFDTINRDNDYGFMHELFLDDKSLLRTKVWLFLYYYDFCYNPDGTNEPCFLQGINADGKDEIVFEYGSGGSNGAMDIDIFTIDSVATLIGKFDGLNKIFAWLPDIDGDNIQEVVFYDNLFQCWNCGCAGSPRLPLIWKWDGSRYRLANFKFRDHILEDYDYNPEDLEMCVDAFSRLFSVRYRYDPYPTCIWFAMLTQIYAGNQGFADSIFNHYWPAELLDKNKFYEEFNMKLKNGFFWEELQKSNW